MDEQARALLIVGALLSGASSTAGFVGGRISAPEPEVRFVHIPVPAINPPAIELAPLEPEAVPAVPPPAAVPETEPPVAAPEAKSPEAKPLPRPRPKIEIRPRPEKKKETRRSAPVRAMPSCSAIKKQYDAMSWPQRMAAYRIATPEEVAHGKRCLGF